MYEFHSIRAERAIGKAAVFLVYGEVEHEAVSIEYPDVLARQQTEEAAQGTVANLFRAPEVDRVKGT